MKRKSIKESENILRSLKVNYRIAVVDDYNDREWQPAYEDWRDAVTEFRELANIMKEPLNDNTEVYMNSGVCNGVRVWNLDWAWGTMVTMSSLNTDPADWWDEAWDSDVESMLEKEDVESVTVEKV